MTLMIRAMTKVVIMFTTWFSLGASKSSPGGFCLSGSELWEQKDFTSTFQCLLSDLAPSLQLEGGRLFWKRRKLSVASTLCSLEEKRNNWVFLWLSKLSNRWTWQGSHLRQRWRLDWGEGRQLAWVGQRVKGGQVRVRRVRSVLSHSSVPRVHPGPQELLSVVSFARHLRHRVWMMRSLVTVMLELRPRLRWDWGVPAACRSEGDFCGCWPATV